MDFPETPSDFHKIQRNALQAGFRQGLSDGRESNFQDNFDMGFSQGIKSGFSLGEYKGFFTAQNRFTKTSKHVEILDTKKGLCNICLDQSLLKEENLKEIIKNQKDSLEKHLEKLQENGPISHV